MPYCTKGHRHNTAPGATKCDADYADRRVKKIMNHGRDRDVTASHQPARMVMRGIVPVHVFRESGNRPIPTVDAARNVT